MRQRHPAAPEQGVRLLIESPDPVLEISEFRRFRDAGFVVAWCAGPQGSEGCPLAQCQPCALAGWADVVLCGLPLEGRRGQDTIRGLHECYPQTPVVVPSPEEPDPAWLELTNGCTRLPHATSVAGQIRELHRVAGDAEVADGG